MSTQRDLRQAASLSQLCSLQKLRAERRAGLALADLDAAERDVSQARTQCDAAQADWHAAISGPGFDPALAGLQGQHLRRQQDQLGMVAGRRDQADSANEAALAALAISRGREDVAEMLLGKARAVARRRDEDRMLAAAEDIRSRTRRGR